jgi:hypothetical protein
VGLIFYIVDVFAEEKYAGNQLAVVRGGFDLADEALEKIALEMNYSEITFVLSDEEVDGGYDVRIFTPGGEVPFAGHPTLGTAYVIRLEILAEPADRVTLNLKAGRIPVTFGEVLWMRQLPPTFGSKLDREPAARGPQPRTDGPGRPVLRAGSIHRPPGHCSPAERPGRPRAVQGRLGPLRRTGRTGEEPVRLLPGTPR